MKSVSWHVSAQKSKTWSGLSEISWLKIGILKILFFFSLYFESNVQVNCSFCLRINRPWVCLYLVSAMAASALIWPFILFLNLSKSSKFISGAARSLKTKTGECLGLEMAVSNNSNYLHIIRHCQYFKPCIFACLHSVSFMPSHWAWIELADNKWKPSGWTSTILLKCTVLWY